MRGRFAGLLVLLLVPAVVLSGTRAAEAATNANPWKSVDLHATASRAFDIDCPAFSSRYTAAGTGVEWAEAGCYDSIDTEPFGNRPPQAGTDYRLTFSGVRAGAAGKGWESFGSWKGNTNGKCFVNGKLDPWGGTDPSGTSNWECRFKPVAGEVTSADSWLAIARYESGSVRTWTYASPGTYRSVVDYGWALPVIWEICNGMGDTSGTIAQANCGASGTLGWVYFPPAGQTAPEPQPGAGAGDPCQVQFAGVTTANAEDSWTRQSGTIPAGSATFPASGSGACQVTRICVEFTSEGWGQDGEWKGCETVSFGAPAGAPDPAAPEPTAPPKPTPEKAPQPEDEQSFWGDLLDGIFALARVISKGLLKVVEAVGAVAGAILDGLAALFIPDPSSWDTAGMKSQLEARPPMSVVSDLGTVASGVATGYSDASGCATLVDLGTVAGTELELECSVMKSTPGFEVLYNLVRAGLWLLTGWGIYRLCAARFERGGQ